MFYPPYSAKVTLLTLLFLGGSGAARAQAAPPPADAAAPAQAPAAAPAPVPTSFPMTNLRPALANVQTAITNLNVSRWKAPNDIRTTTQQDINSMQRDLNTTLPGLLTQADAAAASGPPALSPAFAVFRNLDALYDVMLRVTETAGLAGSASDASSLEEARAGLEDGRAKLGAWLLQAIGAQDAQVARLQAPAAVHAAPAPPPPPNKIVVNDGPDTTKPHKKKPPPTPAPQ
jgi:hypothetical protein